MLASRVSHNLSSLLGYQPVLGRDLSADDDRDGAAPVVLLGHGFWQRQFAGNPQIIGRAVDLNASPHTVVSILPPEATFPPSPDLWIPLAMNADQDPGWFLRGVGRLKP